MAGVARGRPGRRIGDVIASGASEGPAAHLVAASSQGQAAAQASAGPGGCGFREGLGGRARGRQALATQVSDHRRKGRPREAACQPARRMRCQLDNPHASSPRSPPAHRTRTCRQPCVAVASPAHPPLSREPPEAMRRSEPFAGQRLQETRADKEPFAECRVATVPVLEGCRQGSSAGRATRRGLAVAAAP